MKRLDQKLARIHAGQYTPADFIIADAKDPDMGPSLWASGPKRNPDGTWTRYRSRAEFLDQIRAIVRQDIVDVMLASAGNLDLLCREGLFDSSAVQPAIRANDTTDIWLARGATYSKQPSRPFRSADLARTREAGIDLGLYSITFNNDLDADYASLQAFGQFRRDVATHGMRYFLEVFNPNVETGIAPDVLPHFVNDSIVRCLAGVAKADRPLFLKMPYNGPKALDELASWDPSLVVGVLGGGAGTTRDCFELIAQAERYGARVALFGRKINLAESPLAIVALMREVASRNVAPAEAVRAYHAELEKQGLTALRSFEDDERITEAVLKHAAA
jgi:hypothetical protein